MGWSFLQRCEGVLHPKITGMDFFVVFAREKVPDGFYGREGGFVEDWVSDVGEAVGQNALVWGWFLEEDEEVVAGGLWCVFSVGGNLRNWVNISNRVETGDFTSELVFPLKGSEIVFGWDLQPSCLSIQLQELIIVSCISMQPWGHLHKFLFPIDLTKDLIASFQFLHGNRPIASHDSCRGGEARTHLFLNCASLLPSCAETCGEVGASGGRSDVKVGGQGEDQNGGREDQFVHMFKL